MYISIILIHIEGLHENVENVRKSKKNRINFWKMWIWEILKIVFWRFFRSYGPASSDLCVLGVVGTQQTAKRKCSYAFLIFHIFEIYSIFLDFLTFSTFSWSPSICIKIIDMYMREMPNSLFSRLLERVYVWGVHNSCIPLEKIYRSYKLGMTLLTWAHQRDMGSV